MPAAISAATVAKILLLGCVLAAPGAAWPVAELAGDIATSILDEFEEFGPVRYRASTFDLNGEHLVHFAGYEKHVGFYPAPSAIEAFRDGLRPYKTAKGSVRFPLNEPLPAELITRMVEFRVREVTGGDSV